MDIITAILCLFLISVGIMAVLPFLLVAGVIIVHIAVIILLIPIYGLLYAGRAMISGYIKLLDVISILSSPLIGKLID